MIDQDSDAGALGQIENALHLLLTDDFIGNQNILNASLDKYCSLANFLTANAYSPHVDLIVSDHRALMTFGMRANTNTPLGHGLLKTLHITLKCVEIQN